MLRNKPALCRPPQSSLCSTMAMDYPRKQKSEAGGEGEVELQHPECPRIAAWSLSWWRGIWTGFSSQMQLLLHTGAPMASTQHCSFFTAFGVIQSLCISPLLMQQRRHWLLCQPGATWSRYPKDTFPLRGLTWNMHPLSPLSISMHTCAYFADYFLN